MNIRSLPNNILKRIFSYLSFDDIAKLRGLSKTVHRAVRELLNAGFLNLGPSLAIQYTMQLIRTKNSNNGDVLEIATFRSRLLKLLRSEHSILLAYCRHYIASNGVASFSAGKILDLFYELRDNDTTIATQEEENNRVAKLVLLIDQYLDWFDRHRSTNDERSSWFGACIVDVLDSYLAAKYHLVASHSRSMVKLAGQYTINGYVEAPPEIGDPLGRHVGKNELLQVIRYLRKHARWHNFVRAFQDDFDDSEDVGEDEEEKIFTKETTFGYDRIYKKKCYTTVDNYSNGVSLRVIINLQCHRSLAPARLNSGGDVENRSIAGRTSIGTSTSDISTNDELKDANESGNSSSQTGSLRNEAGWYDNRGTNDGMYSFSLEMKCVYPKKSTSNQSEKVERFGETTLNINHTSDSIFAARSECRLY